MLCTGVSLVALVLGSQVGRVHVGSLYYGLGACSIFKSAPPQAAVRLGGFMFAAKMPSALYMNYSLLFVCLFGREYSPGNYNCQKTSLPCAFAYCIVMFMNISGGEGARWVAH
jgi:hypothetical protein